MREGYGADMGGSRRPLHPLSRWRSLALRTVAVSTLALLTASCFEIEMDVVVREDGSGSVSITTRTDEAALDFLVWLEEVPAEDSCRQFLTDRDGVGLDSVMFMNSFISFGQGTLSIDSESDCVVSMSAAWTAEESHATLIALQDHEQFGLRRLDNGGWRFDMDMGELNDEEVSLDDLDSATALGFDAPAVAISVTLPGDVVEHNADSVMQSTYTWEFDLISAGEIPASLYVETVPNSGLGPEAIGAIVAGVLLALAALVTLRRHQETKAAARDRHGIEAVGDPAEATALDIDTPDESSGTDTADVSNEGSEGGTSTTDR